MVETDITVDLFMFDILLTVFRLTLSCDKPNDKSYVFLMTAISHNTLGLFF